MSIPECACWTVLALAAMSPAGCRLIEESTRAPVKAVMAVVPGSKPTPLDPAVLQVEIQRYADDFIGRIVGVLEEYARGADTDEARSQALRWKLIMVTSVVSLTSGPSPVAGLVDLLAITTIMRSVLEEHWVKTPQGAAFQPWLDTSRSLEAEIWELAAGVFNPEQQEELRQAIRRWQETNPGSQMAFFARPLDCAAVVRQAKEQLATKGGGVFSLIGLDPMAGLDPAVREVTRTRLFAERAMFTMQRMPSLLRWQIEFLVDQVTRGSKVAKALNDAAQLAESAGQIGRATESASQTIAQLPDHIREERKAIIAALEAQEAGLRELSAEVERTLTAGEKMSTSLQATIITFDALMKRFGVGEPKPNDAPRPDSKPFDVLDYARTAEEVAAMAKGLDVLIKDAAVTLDSPALDKRFQDLGAVAERAMADARSLVNHAGLLGACLILLTFACALAYRRLVPRGAKTRSGAAVETHADAG